VREAGSWLAPALTTALYSSSGNKKRRDE